MTCCCCFRLSGIRFFSHLNMVSQQPNEMVFTFCWRLCGPPFNGAVGFCCILWTISANWHLTSAGNHVLDFRAVKMPPNLMHLHCIHVVCRVFVQCALVFNVSTSASNHNAIRKFHAVYFTNVESTKLIIWQSVAHLVRVLLLQRNLGRNPDIERSDSREKIESCAFPVLLCSFLTFLLVAAYIVAVGYTMKS